VKFARKIYLLLIILIQFGFPQSGAFTGKITDEDTGNPVENARVRILGTRFDLRTDRYGIYRADYEIPDNYYIVEVTAPGYQHWMREDVTFLAGDTVTINVALKPTKVGLNTVTMRSTSSRPENAIKAPAALSVINLESVESAVTINSDILLQNVAGMDVAATGLDRRLINIHGFNDIFNTAPYELSDYRQAAVPSLGVNLYPVMPISLNDIYRIEVIRDPSSAVYGPGAESGVVHYISKSPFLYPGLTISAGAGERSTVLGNLRGAAVLFKRVGIKVNGQYAGGDNWRFDSRDRFDQRQLATDAPGVERNFDYKKMNANGELQLKIAQNVLLTAGGGWSNLSDNVMTHLGTAYADSLVYTYGQLRLHAGRFFAQAYMNRIDAGEFRFYGLNTTMVDKGRQVRGQAQYDFHFSGGSKQLVFGADVNIITPQTEGTFYGRNEENTKMQQLGGYLHYLQKLSPKIDFTLALRGDYNDVFENISIAPRVGVVYHTNPFNALRLTYNRASAIPHHPSLFLDIPLRAVGLNENGGYELVFQGRGAFTFNTFRNTRQVTMMAALPDLPQNPFGQQVSLDQFPVGVAYLNTAFSTESLFAGPEENIPPDLRPLDPDQRRVLVELLNLMGEQTLAGGETTPGILGFPDESDIGFQPVETPLDVEPLKMPVTNTVELGYKGLVANRFLYGVDGFYSLKQNFISPIRLETPFVYLPRDYVHPRVLDFVASGDQRVKDLIDELGIGPSATVGLMTTLYSQTPSGIVQPDAGEDGSGVLAENMPNALGGLMTYRNFGKVQYWGFDLGLQFMATYNMILFGNFSFISDDFFDNKDTKLSVALNAPTLKAGLGFLYNNPQGFAFGIAGRYVKGFPVQSGPYIGGLPEPYGRGIGAVESYVVVDLNFGYSLRSLLRGLRFDVTVNNIFDHKHRQYVGAPKIGRLSLARVSFSL
jgi:iron complex outermembrane receptor protein